MYNMMSSSQVNILVVTFVVFVGVDAFVYRYAVDKSNEKPLVSERFSIDSNGNTESTALREVINHVHHQHEQTIGNVHVLTNIDIANTITILNASAPAHSQPIDVTTTKAPGKLEKEIHFL